MNTRTFRTGWALAGGALLVAACGGGGGGDAVVPPVATGSDVPLSATRSSAGAFAFVQSVAARSDDTAMPVAVGDETLATSETDEPDPGV